MKFNYLLIITLVFLFACNKEKHYSNKLIKGQRWNVVDISVDGSGLGYFGSWKIISDGSIYDVVPRVDWLFENGNTVFEWQFQEKGKRFQLNYQQLCEECNGEDLSSLDSICYNLTGNYEVIRHGNKMEFTSSETIGYTGKNVRISISRVK